MKSRLFITSLVFIGILIYRAFIFPLTSINGTYVNNNLHPILEGPSSEIDTLKVYDNLTFENHSWGKGNIEINNYNIVFKYTSEFGKASFHTTIYRPFLSKKIRVSLNDDMEYYYEKID